MILRSELLTAEFRSLSARLGRNPLQVQGPGGNTSIKDDVVMWVKASGTELAQAEDEDIFVAVDRRAALAEARGTQGDGSCRETVLDSSISLRPSVETTLHAVLDHAVVAHTHSVATLVHAISPQGRRACADKLAGLPYAMVPYAKPGLPLTQEILARLADDTKIFVLQNHGLICCGGSVREVADLTADVEDRLALAPVYWRAIDPQEPPPGGFQWAEESWIACNARASRVAAAGSYYPDHVTFLGPALPSRDHDGRPPVLLIEGQGIALRNHALSAERAMLRCLSDVLSRLPEDWQADEIGPEAEIALLDWDAEKYRQALAAQR